MGCFHAERDAQMLPYYEMTLALTTMRDLAPGDSAVLKAVLSNPALARSLAARVPDLVPNVFDEDARRRIGGVGHLNARRD